MGEYDLSVRPLASLNFDLRFQPRKIAGSEGMQVREKRERVTLEREMWGSKMNARTSGVWMNTPSTLLALLAAPVPPDPSLLVHCDIPKIHQIKSHAKNNF